MAHTHFILATAGHVDHGKSALVRALSGVDPDRLPEEKARGITIDLGFAHIDLSSPKAVSPAEIYRVGIVDVPGHEDFVKNMVAGVGSIDLALLVVAADDGWMPQTEEHLQILTYLGIQHGVVALTKIDLAASKKDATQAVREKLGGTSLAEAPIVATSVVTGRGIDELKLALATELARTPHQADLGKPRLAVDRAFTLRGAGTVVTGTLTGGRLSRGQAVVVQPGARPARIRTVQSYNREVEQATPGSRVALNLPDLQPGGGAPAASAIGRGDVVTLPELGRASDTLDVRLEMSPRSPNARPLKEPTKVRMHHGSGNFPAFVYLQGKPTLLPGESALAELRFEFPVYAFAGDRFILRDWSEQQTLAGGIVLDPDASRRGFRLPGRQNFLRARADHPDDSAVFVASELARDGAAEKSLLLMKSRFSHENVRSAIDRLASERKLIVQGSKVFDSAWWSELKREAAEAIDASHKAHPEQVGLKLADLRQKLLKKMGRLDVFEPLVEDICRDGCARAGASIRRSNHRPALPPALQSAGARLRSVLSSKGLEPPSRKELAPDSVSQQALRFLIQTGEAVEVADEVVVHADAMARAIEGVRGYIKSHGGATVSELKQTLNSSRRIMVPLLEKLDRDGITLRQGDKRVLRPAK